MTHNFAQDDIMFFVEQRCGEMISANGNLLSKMLPIFCELAMCSIQNIVYNDHKRLTILKWPVNSRTELNSEHCSTLPTAYYNRTFRYKPASDILAVQTLSLLKVWKPSTNLKIAKRGLGIFFGVPSVLCISRKYLNIYIYTWKKKIWV